MIGENGRTRTFTLWFRRPRCSSSYTTSSKAESSGLVRPASPKEKPQLFIHLFSKQRRFAQSVYSPYDSNKQVVGRAGVAPATQEAAVLQTVAHADRRADLCLFGLLMFEQVWQCRREL